MACPYLPFVEAFKKWLLQQLYGKSEARVNSLHGQGIHKLGDGLRVEAISDDGLVEALTDPNGQSFNLVVQWHPEYQVTKNDFYQSIFSAFALACNSYMKTKAVGNLLLTLMALKLGLKSTK